MIIRGKAIDAALRAATPAYRGYLFFGRDEGRIRESAATLARQVVPDLSDPFRVVNLSGARLRDDPASLVDEAASLSMTGGRRVIRIRGATDANTGAFTDFFDYPTADALVIAEAADLGKRSKLRLLFEKAAEAGAAACYPDGAADLEEVIISGLHAYQLTISADAVAYLCGCLGEDREATRREIEKLALYMGAHANDTPGAVSLSDVQACVGNLGTQRLDDICYMAFSGDLGALDTQMSRVLASGESPVGLLRAASGHAMRLQLAAAKIASGTPIDESVRSLRPPVHFARTHAFRNQLRLWDVRRLNQTLSLLMDAETGCKTTGLPDTALCGRALLRVATAAQGALNTIGRTVAAR